VEPVHHRFDDLEHGERGDAYATSARMTRRRFNSEMSAPASTLRPPRGVCYCAYRGTSMYLLLALLSASPLSSFLQEAVERGDVAGVVALVISDGVIVYHEAFGKQDVGRSIPMARDSIFRIASMTKPITSVAAMMLVDEGKLRLDDLVDKYLSDFHPQVITDVDLTAGTYRLRPPAGRVTIRHLMTHTSGIGYDWSDPRAALVEKKTRSAATTLLHDPGERWTYGEGTTVLGLVVEKITGKPLDEFFASRIFGPLGMRQTGFSVPAEKRDRVVTVQQRKDGKLIEKPLRAELSGKARGDGGLYSTAADYGSFLRALLDKRLLSAGSLHALTTNQLGNLLVQSQPTAEPELARPFPLGAGIDGWSLGFQIASSSPAGAHRRSTGSYSWAGFFNTFFWVDPEKKVAAVLLMQMLPFYDERATAVLQGFEERVYAQ
jgi:methyl acetate hydrolase